MAKRKGNKAQMVRDALAALGKDAKPVAIQEHIKAAGGPEIPTVMISSYKSSMKAKGGRGGKGGGRRGRPAGSGRHGGGLIGDIATVRGLIDRHGKADLVKLIDAVG
jgi:hypothetical protein